MPPCLYDCPNPGTWRPVLKLRSRQEGSVTLLRFTKVALCEDHQRSSEVTNFLSVEGFDKLVHLMKEAGKQAPVRKLTSLDWEPVNEDTLPTKSEPAVISI